MAFGWDALASEPACHVSAEFHRAEVTPSIIMKNDAKWLGRRRRVLYLTNSGPDARGPRTWILEQFAAHGWKHLIVEPSGDRSRQACPGLIFPFAKHRLLALGDIFGIMWIAVAAMSMRPDVIHARGLKPILMAGIATAVFPSVRLLGHVTGLGRMADSSRSQRGGLITLALRLGWRWKRRILIPQNVPDAKVLRSRLGRRGRISVVRGSGVALGTVICANPEPTSTPNIVFIGRLLRAKGVADFVAAAAILRARGVSGEFILAGDAPESDRDAVARDELEGWVAEGTVRWLGWQEDTRKLIRESRAVCLPTTYGEGVPRVLLEACAESRAVITTDSPGCNEICLHGFNGFLVPGSDPEALAEAMERVLVDETLAQKLGAHGRQLVAKIFSRDIVLRRLMTIYHRLVGELR